MYVMGWIRPPAPTQGGLARDELYAECVLSTAPIPGTETILQKKTTTTKPAGWVERSVFFLCVLTFSGRGDNLQQSGSLGRSFFSVDLIKSRLLILCTKLVSILLGDDFTTVSVGAAADHPMYIWDWMRPPASVGGPNQTALYSLVLH